MTSRRYRPGGEAESVGLAPMALLFLALFSPLPAEAALPPLSGEALQSQAEVILTGTSTASRVLMVRKPGAPLYLVRLQVAVEKVEKGHELLAAPDSKTTPAVIEIRCWRIRKPDKVEPLGHGNIPADGSRFRMWLKKSQEGFWEPLEPNGIELLDQSPEMIFTQTKSQGGTRSFLIGIAGSLLLIGAIAVYMLRRSRLPR